MTEPRIRSQWLSEYVRVVSDFPAPGVSFKDITPLLADADAFHGAVSGMADMWSKFPPDYVAGIDARGFILGAAVAPLLGAGFVPIRKEGKLPPSGDKWSINYKCEYGDGVLEVNRPRGKGYRVLLVDDVCATGGTLKAAADLLEQAGYDVVGICTLIDLKYLNKFEWRGQRVRSLLEYQS